MSSITVRPAEEGHLDRMTEIEGRCFSVPWPKTLLQQEIVDESSIVLCAFWDDTLAGFCSLTQIYDEGHVTNVAVDGKYRRRGVADALVTELIRRARERGLLNLTLVVRVSIEAAIGLYEKHGFRGVGVRRKYYTDNNEDALIMWRRESGEGER